MTKTNCFTCKNEIEVGILLPDFGVKICNECADKIITEIKRGAEKGEDNFLTLKRILGQ